MSDVIQPHNMSDHKELDNQLNILGSIPNVESSSENDLKSESPTFSFHLQLMNGHSADIPVRRFDTYVNATALCKDVGEDHLEDWLYLHSTIRTIKDLSLATGIPESELKEEYRTSTNCGVWLHPELAVELARWLKISKQVSRWLRWHERNATKVAIAQLQTKLDRICSTLKAYNIHIIP